MFASTLRSSMMNAIKLLSSTAVGVTERSPVLIKARKVSARIAFLALDRVAHLQEPLAMLLWSDRDDVHAHSLNQCARVLRQTIDDTAQSRICSDGDNLRLYRHAVDIDVDEFKTAVAAADMRRMDSNIEAAAE
jgi:DNA-binding SARP family transcriptional activator